MVSDIDIADWERTETEVKLYAAPVESIVSLKDQPDYPFFFHHVDGMYSFSKTLSGEVWHPAAWSDVFLWKKIK